MRWLAIGALLLFAGCNSYDIVDTKFFVDDDGQIVQVDYGVAEKNHVNYFIAPNTNRKTEFMSKLVVDVTLPDGDDFTAWQCMNFYNLGTQYRTDDEEWIFFANGFTCEIYHVETINGRQYPRRVYQGVFCNTRTPMVEKDERWHKVRPRQNNYRTR